jgi:hypothetical protein
MLSNKGKIEEMIEKYSSSVKDAELLRDAFETMIAKGVPHGCYQDYTALNAALCLISCIEAECLVRAKEDAE